MRISCESEGSFDFSFVFTIEVQKQDICCVFYFHHSLIFNETKRQDETNVFLTFLHCVAEILTPTFQVRYKDKTTFEVELTSFSAAIRTFYVQYREDGTYTSLLAKSHKLLVIKSQSWIQDFPKRVPTPEGAITFYLA